MSKNENEFAVDESIFSAVERKAPPVSQHLKQRIIAETRQMPQQQAVQRAKPQSYNHVFGWRLLPVYGFVLATLGTVVLFSSTIPVQPETNEVTASQTTFTIPEELAWQDVMLMHDELAFIDL